MIAFDHARTYNPSHRLSTATGIVNVGGFLAALLAIFFIGLAMDLQGAGTPDTYSLEAFRLAFLTQVPLWALGAAFIVFERKRTRVHLGLDEPRSRPRRSRQRAWLDATGRLRPSDDVARTRRSPGPVTSRRRRCRPRVPAALLRRADLEGPLDLLAEGVARGILRRHPQVDPCTRVGHRGSPRRRP